MKAIAITAAIVLIVFLILFLRNQRNRSRDFKTTDEFVQWLADEAVKDAASNNHIELDYSPQSIERVEQILGRLHNTYTQTPSSISVKGLSAAYGAYIGEVIRRTESNVHWERDDPVMGEKAYPLRWGTGSSYPMGWCQKRIVNGEEDNVWIKYKILKENKGSLSLKPRQ
jgi:hypothetical protein